MSSINSRVHHTAIIHEDAKISESCLIGPYCIVGPNVTLGENVVLKSHVVIEGYTNIGSNNTIFPFASIGNIPQDMKYDGEPSVLEIGNNNVIREYCNFNPGTRGGNMITKIGNNSLFMVGVHIAHNCVIGDHAVFANNVTLGGHVQVGEHVTIGGLSAVHQFVRIGDQAMIGGKSGVEKDIIPYGLAVGNRAKLTGLNLIGLKRRGFSKEVINILREVYDFLFQSQTGVLFAERIEQVAIKHRDCEEIVRIINFIKHDSSRILCKPLENICPEAEI